MSYGPKKDKSIATRIERSDYRRQQLVERTAGTGRWIFQNNTPGDLGLPKAAEDGRKSVPPRSRSAEGSKFIGDSYFMMMVPQTLTIVEDLNVKNEKLLTEQPPTVNNQGKVEYVVQSKDQKLNEGKPGKPADVLLTEDPKGGIVIVE